MRVLSRALGALVTGVAALALLRNTQPSETQAAGDRLVQTLQCLQLRTQADGNRRYKLLAGVKSVSRRIAELRKAHAHDADGRWPAEAVYALGEIQRTLIEASCFASGSSMAQVEAATLELEPLLAHAGLLGHGNRTAALDGHPVAQETSAGAQDGDPSRRQHGDMHDIHDVKGAHPAIGYAYA